MFVAIAERLGIEMKSIKKVTAHCILADESTEAEQAELVLDVWMTEEQLKELEIEMHEQHGIFYADDETTSLVAQNMDLLIHSAVELLDCELESWYID